MKLQQVSDYVGQTLSTDPISQVNASLTRDFTGGGTRSSKARGG